MESLFVECAVRAALIAVATAVVLRLVGVQPASARHAAWTSVMLTMLLLPVWTAWGPKTPIRLLPPVERGASVDTLVQNSPPVSVRLTAMRQVKTVGPHPAGREWTWKSGFWIVYGFGAIGLLARLAVGTVRTHRLRSHASVRDGKRISSECACPITVGWLHPVVILPEHWQEWPLRQLDAVLTHEREHARRRDPLIHWLALLNRALFWFHPLSWWLERKLSLLAEEACDAAVLAGGHTPQEYSEYLLDIARSVSRSGSRLGILGMAMPGSLLPQRIRQILNSSEALPISRTKVAVAVAACAISSASLASGSLDHARAQVQPRLSRLAPSWSSEIAATKTGVDVPASRPRENPGVLLAQAARAPVPAPPQQAVPAPASDSAGKERQLEAAFLSSAPMTDMSIAVEINYFQMNRAEYFVPLTVKIPGQELGTARNAGAERTTFDFLGEIEDAFGAVVCNVRDQVSIDLSGAPATPVEYDAGFTLLPGRYFLKLMARNNETGRMGSYETAFAVPNLNKEEEGIPISSVVLSNQRVEWGAAGNARNTRLPANPLVVDGRKLIPSVDRLFSRSRDMYVYLQAYQRETGSAQPLVAFATFYQGQAKALETGPMEVTQLADSRSGAVPLSLSISLAALVPGKYICEVTVRSPVTQKTASWQAPIVIEP
jgi:hypothetical protein